MGSDPPPNPGRFTLLNSTDRPPCDITDLDDQLLGYRQPQRAIVTALTHRGVPLEQIAALTVDVADHARALESLACHAWDSPSLRLALRAQGQFRISQGSTPTDPLLVPDNKTLARFVNDAAADLGINAGGRRVERTQDTTAWLARLGIRLRTL